MASTTTTTTPPLGSIQCSSSSHLCLHRSFIIIMMLVGCLSIPYLFFMHVGAQTNNGFIASFLQPHNNARAAVGVAPISWDQNLANYAASYAAQDAAQRRCQLVHSGGPYGENLFWGSGKTYTGIDAVMAWVAESRSYNYQSNKCIRNAMCGHYTQVVWSRSTAVGCAVQACPDGRSTFIICSYNPPGNYLNQRPY